MKFWICVEKYFYQKNFNSSQWDLICDACVSCLFYYFHEVIFLHFSVENFSSLKIITFCTLIWMHAVYLTTWIWILEVFFLSSLCRDYRPQLQFFKVIFIDVAWRVPLLNLCSSWTNFEKFVWHPGGCRYQWSVTVELSIGSTSLLDW